MWRADLDEFDTNLLKVEYWWDIFNVEGNTNAIPHEIVGQVHIPSQFSPLSIFGIFSTSIYEASLYSILLEFDVTTSLLAPYKQEEDTLYPIAWFENASNKMKAVNTLLKHIFTMQPLLSYINHNPKSPKHPRYIIIKSGIDYGRSIFLSCDIYHNKIGLR